MCLHVLNYWHFCVAVSWLRKEWGSKLGKHRWWQDSQEPSHSPRDREQLLSLEELPASWAGGSRDVFENWYPCCWLEVTHALDHQARRVGMLLWSVPCPVGTVSPPRSITADTGSDSGARAMQCWSLVWCRMATIPAVPPHHGRARVSSPSQKPNQIK